MRSWVTYCACTAPAPADASHRRSTSALQISAVQGSSGSLSVHSLQPRACRPAAPAAPPHLPPRHACRPALPATLPRLPPRPACRPSPPAALRRLPPRAACCLAPTGPPRLVQRWRLVQPASLRCLLLRPTRRPELHAAPCCLLPGAPFRRPAPPVPPPPPVAPPRLLTRPACCTAPPAALRRLPPRAACRPVSPTVAANAPKPLAPPAVQAATRRRLRHPAAMGYATRRRVVCRRHVAPLPPAPLCALPFVAVPDFKQPPAARERSRRRPLLLLLRHLCLLGPLVAASCRLLAAYASLLGGQGVGVRDAARAPAGWGARGRR
jgi:hypothetical protein